MLAKLLRLSKKYREHEVKMFMLYLEMVTKMQAHQLQMQMIKYQKPDGDLITPGIKGEQP